MFAETTFPVFREILDAKGVVRGFVIPGAGGSSRKRARYAGGRGRVARREGPDLGALHSRRRRAEPDSEDGGRGGDPRGAGAHGAPAAAICW